MIVHPRSPTDALQAFKGLVSGLLFALAVWIIVAGLWWLLP